jgi:iron complex outermembrane recepter protein
MRLTSRLTTTVGTARPRPARTLGLLAAALASAVLPAIARADTGLEEVIVTAERRTEKVHDVPVAITAITSAELENRGVRQAGDIIAGVPNLTLSSPYGEEAQPTFALRGVTTNDWSQNQSSPIAMNVDEVYKSVGAVQALQIYDLDRVEVLRGPQGTLYGKNATGGAMNFYSKNPSLSEYDGYLTAGFGNYSAYSVRGAVGGPIVDGTLGWRAAVLYDQRDGWVRSVVPGVEPLNGVDAVAGRFSLLYKPTADVSAVLKVAVSRSGGTPYGVHALNIVPSFNGCTCAYDWFSNGAKYAIHKDIRNDSVSLKIDWQLSDHYTLTAVTGYDYGRWYEKSDDGGIAYTDPPNPVAIHIDDPNTYTSSINAISQEIRIASHDTGAFTWLAGGYYGRDSTHATVEFHFADSGVFGGNVTPSGQQLYGFDTYNNFQQIRVSKAAFLNMSYAVTPEVTLRAGIRYTKDTISIQNFYSLLGGLVGPPGPGPADFPPTAWTQAIGDPNNPAIPISQTSLAPQGATHPELSQTNSNVSIKVGVDWKPSDEVLTYLSFSQGYRGAAFNGQAFYAVPELTFAKPEKLDSYEIGVKSQFLDRRLELNAAAFYYAYHDQQFLDSFTFPPPYIGTGFHTVNAPKSRVTGGELELRAKPIPALDLRASLGVLSTKYLELTLGGADLSDKLIMAPDLNVGASFDWRAAQFAVGDLHLAVDANYYSKQYFDAQNTGRIAQSGYSVVNARVSLLAGANRRFSVAAWGKNLTNREYLAYGLNQQSGIGLDYALVGEPRTYGIEATYRF